MCTPFIARLDASDGASSSALVSALTGALVGALVVAQCNALFAEQSGQLSCTVMPAKDSAVHATRVATITTFANTAHNYPA